jgi:hypothetical protein
MARNPGSPADWGDSDRSRCASAVWGWTASRPAAGRLRKQGLPIESRPRNVHVLDGTRSWQRPRPRYHQYRISPEQVAEALARLFYVGESSPVTPPFPSSMQPTNASVCRSRSFVVLGEMAELLLGGQRVLPRRL